MNLRERLKAFRRLYEAGYVDRHRFEDASELMQRATRELENSGWSRQVLRVGDSIPRFTLSDPYERRLSIDQHLRDGPLIINFYRGSWCPYCNIELQALQAALPAIDCLGAQIIAISPQTREYGRRTIRENELTFPVLSDVYNEVATAFGLKFIVPDYLADLYRLLGYDLPTFNGDSSWTLPMPSRFVVSQNGAIIYAEINPDYTKRPDPSEMFPFIRQAAASPRARIPHDHLPQFKARQSPATSHLRRGKV